MNTATVAVETNARPLKASSPVSLFSTQRIGSFQLRFADSDGQPIKPKKSDGFLTLKLRGGGSHTQHFLLECDGAPPVRKVLMRVIEEAYSKSSHYKVGQIHLEARFK